jgi:hypothetical protein
MVSGRPTIRQVAHRKVASPHLSRYMSGEVLPGLVAAGVVEQHPYQVLLCLILEAL